jgi:hypothetical protein
MIRYFKLNRIMKKVLQDNAELFKMLAESKKEPYTNLTWEEDGLWKGWNFNQDKNRYYFDDIGNESFMGLWEEKWIKEGPLV